ncbi:MAG: hydrogenase maturation protein [Burkholderiales bacterium]|nr:hydrogenase maturation protein [Burkholderiales bacterium]
MRILLLCHSFNSLSQRLWVALRADGHQVSVELDIADAVTEEAVALWRADVVLASFMKRKIPESVWSTLPCLVVHPGPPGDRGPSALDWAVLRGEPAWGVSVLQANEAFDAGPVRAHGGFAMRKTTKASLYRREVSASAVAAVREALAGLSDAALAAPAGAWQPLMSQASRAIDWLVDDTATVLRKLRSADGIPGVASQLFGQPAHLFDGHEATADTLARLPGTDSHAPGTAMAKRGPAVLLRTRDGGVWLGHVRRAPDPPGGLTLKLAATKAFTLESTALPELPVALMRDAAAEYDELHYQELGPAGARVGCLSFAFHNGAMSTRQCQRLQAALREVRQRSTQVLVLAGGPDYFCNGIHLHDIEAHADQPGDSAADASWRNINAMNDVALELLTLTDRLTVSALRGNAGAGGCFLALAADEVWAHGGVVLNPHYKNMGNLYGSEYWTYTLPRRVGLEQAQRIMQGRLPMGAAEAQRMGLVDAVLSAETLAFEPLALERALALAAQPDLGARLAAKQAARAADEARQPLAAYRDAEMKRMHRNFYGFDPSYHVARHHFVYRKPHAWTPRHLALHR